MSSGVTRAFLRADSSRGKAKGEWSPTRPPVALGPDASALGPLGLGLDLAFGRPSDGEAIALLVGVLRIAVGAVEVVCGWGEGEAAVGRREPILEVLDDDRLVLVGPVRGGLVEGDLRHAARHRRVRRLGVVLPGDRVFARRELLPL